MKIKRLDFNWFQSGADGEIGEDYYSYELGQKRRKYNNLLEEKTIIDIIENRYMDGTFYYDVIFSDDSMERIFNPNKVYYEEME